MMNNNKNNNMPPKQNNNNMMVAMAPQPQEEDTIKLPTKIINQHTFQTMNQAKVLLNGFQMSLDKAVPHIYQFELHFIGEKAPKKGAMPGAPGDMIALERGPHNDESKETRRRLCWELFGQLLQQEHPFFGNDKHIFVYDCAILLYSTKDLGMKPNGSHAFQLHVNKNTMEERCLAYIRNMHSIHVNLLRTEVVINLKDAAANYIRGDRSVVQFLELLTSQEMFQKGKHICFGNRFYEQCANIELGGVAPILKKGLQKNVRYVGDTMQDAQPIVQIDPKKSPFFPAKNVVDYLCSFFSNGGRPMDARQFEDKIWRQGNMMEQANKQIRNVVVQTKHLENEQMTFANVGLTTKPAQDIYFPRHGHQVGVIQHIEQTYKFRIKYPRLPCLIKRTPQMESFFPMELLVICDGQRIPLEKQTPKLTEQMIRQCQLLPVKLPDQIKEERKAANVINTNPYLQAQKVQINEELMKAKAEVLFPPAIQYNGRDCVEPDPRGFIDWKMVGREVNPNRQYFQPAEWPKRWAIIIVQNAIPTNVCQEFIRRFTDTARQKGIADCSTEKPILVKWELWEEANLEFVEEKFKYFEKNNCRFVMVFAQGKRQAHPGDIHHVIKLMEQKYKVLTQHVGPDMANKAAGLQGGPPGGAQMVIENILFKTNLKLGGVNYVLNTSNAFKHANRNDTNILADQWLGAKRMFFGLDWSHAPPQSLYARQRGEEPANPTIIGMAYTIGKHCLAMRGTYWYQQARLTTITKEYMAPFMKNIKEALLAYEAKNGEFPEHLFILRGGASEGEFKRVAYWEGSAFTQAFNEIRKERPQQKLAEPAVTIIVCQRQSNYRIVPERIDSRAKAPQQNVQPGTVVDKGVMNAALTEFLLVGHKALQGTAQPIRCTVVLEHRPDSGPAAKMPPRVPVEELENIVYALNYSHGICCMSTALPGPLFEAGELTKRGKNNWKTSTNDGEKVQHFELPPREGEGTEAAQQQLDQKKGEYFAGVSKKLKPEFPGAKFWA